MQSTIIRRAPSGIQIAEKVVAFTPTSINSTTPFPITVVDPVFQAVTGMSVTFPVATDQVAEQLSVESFSIALGGTLPPGPPGTALKGRLSFDGVMPALVPKPFTVDLVPVIQNGVFWVATFVGSGRLFFTQNGTTTATLEVAATAAGAFNITIGEMVVLVQ